MPRRCAHLVPICLVCAATLGGHYVVARKLDVRQDFAAGAKFATRLSADQDIPILEPIDEPWAMVGCPDPPPFQEEELAAQPPDLRSIPRMLATLGYETLAGDKDAPADALRPVAGDEPEALLRPLSRRQRDDQAAVRAVIDDELAESSAEERDIWFEELKSLPAEVVRDLLQVRQQMRILKPGHLLSGPARLAPAEPLRPREIIAEPVTQSRDVTEADWSESRRALQTAIDWATHNIANAETFGYKRVEVILSDAIAPAANEGIDCGRGCRLTTVRLDLSQGELIETGRALDLAIDGPGFFLLQSPDEAGDQKLTRRGAITLDSDRRLCIAFDDQTIPLLPVITIPADRSSVEIAVDGTVSATVGDAEVVTNLGKIQLAVFADATHLTAAGSGVYVLSPTLEPQMISPGEPGAGVICQGFLEASNVDLEHEVGLRERRDTILRLLPLSDVPRTAGDWKRTPR